MSDAGVLMSYRIQGHRSQCACYDNRDKWKWIRENEQNKEKTGAREKRSFGISSYAGVV